MSQKVREELGKLHDEWNRLKDQFQKNDGKIDPQEKRRLDAISDKWERIRKVCVADEKIEKTMTDAAGRLTTDADQKKKFQDSLKKLPPDARVAAADVLDVMYKRPQPADQVDEISKVLARLPKGQDIEVGKALNKLGVYIPNLVKPSPSAEDASARIKTMYMGGYNYWVDDPPPGKYVEGPQDDYVRDLIMRAKAEGFKIVLQIDTRRTEAALKAKILADIRAGGGAITDAEFNTHLQILRASREGYEWAEDNKSLSADGKTIRTTPKVNPTAFAAASSFTSAGTVKRGERGYAREGHHTAGKKDNDKSSDEEFPAGLVHEGAMQEAVSLRDEHLSAKSLADITKKGFKVTKTYNEGGNMLVGTLPNGQPYAVIGRDGLLISVFHLEEEFNKPAGDPTKVKVDEFDPANVAKRVAKLEKKQPFDPAEVKDTIKRLEAAGKIPAGADAKQRDKAAKEFLAKIDIVKDIYQEDYDVPREQLIFIPQPDFHIDMHMRPLGPGQVMVNDYGKNIELINEALKLAKKGSWEEQELISMREHAQKMQQVMEPVVKEIKQKLKAANIEPVPAAGVMEGQFPSVTIPKDAVFQLDGVPANDWRIGERLKLKADTGFTRKELAAELLKNFSDKPNVREVSAYILDILFRRHVNFMNAIPATKDGTNEQFYMTNYTSLEPLRDAYVAQLKRQGVERVEWIGNDGGGQGKRSASEQSLDAQGGLDCRENH